MEKAMVQASPVEARERGYTDFNFFAALALPEVCTVPWPPVYLALFEILTERPEEYQGEIMRFALGLPRGHAKTTFLKLLASWLIVYKKVNFLLVVCATDELAKNFIYDLSEILASPNMEAVYGSWHASLYINSKREKRAVYQGRHVTLFGLGAETSVRGVNIANDRPECILCDDAQTKENDASDAKRTALTSWVIATLFKTIKGSGNRYIFWIGNLYSETCLLWRFKEHPDWLSLITSGILEDGSAFWPELRSKESLIKEYRHDEALGEGEIWFAEVMNIPMQTRNSLITGPLPEIENPSQYIPDSCFIVLDPAGYRRSSDDNVATVYYTHDETLCIAEMVGGRWDPKETIGILADLAAKHGASLIGIEDTAYQQTLLFWVDLLFTQFNLNGVEIVPLKPKGRSKTSRIIAFFKEVYAGTVKILRHEDRQKLTWYGKFYDTSKRDNADDWLDSPAYGLDVRKDYFHLLSFDAAYKRHVIEPRAKVVTNNTAF